MITLCAAASYANSLAGEFVFDDVEQIIQNQNLRSWDNVATAFKTSVWSFRDSSDPSLPPPLPYYRPLFTVLLTIEYQLFGLSPLGWHLVSLLLHVSCSVAVFYVLLELSQVRLVASAAALLFAVHPVHAESVAWISGLTDPLFTVSYLSSLYCYLRSRAVKEPGSNEASSRGHKWIALSLVLFVVSAFSKETALTLPILLFCYELINSKDGIASRLATAFRRVAAFALAAGIYLVPRYLVLGQSMFSNPQSMNRPPSQVWLTFPFVVIRYVWHLVWPVGLSVTYGTHFVTSPGSSEFIAPALCLCVGAAVLIALRRRLNVHLWMALLLTFVPLLPVLRLGQVSQEQYLVFDHYLYLSVAGWGYIVAFTIWRATAGILRSKSRPILAPAIASIVLVILHSIGAMSTNASWANSFSVWSNAAAKCPSYWAPHYNTGVALLELKRFDEARGFLQRASALDSNEAVVFDALGRAFAGLGDASNAIDNFNRAIELDPGLFEAHNNLGTVYFANHDYRSAEACFNRALELRPNSLESRYNRGLSRARLGRTAEAAEDLEQVARAAPADAGAAYELGLLYEQLGKIGPARAALERGLKSAVQRDLADQISVALKRVSNGSD